MACSVLSVIRVCKFAMVQIWNAIENLGPRSSTSETTYNLVVNLKTENHLDLNWVPSAVQYCTFANGTTLQCIQYIEEP